MDGTQNLSFILSQNLGEKVGTTGVKDDNNLNYVSETLFYIEVE